MGSSFDEQVAAARREMQKRRAELEKERADKGIPEPALARRAPARSAPARSDTGSRQVDTSASGDYGHLVLKDSIGARSVSIYSNGYVRVGVFGSGQPEKLMSIEYSANIQKKSAAGRGAAMVLTGGLNLLGPKQRGDVWLTIVTDRQTYTLHADPPYLHIVRAARRLAAAGQAVLARLPADQAAQLDGSVPSAPASTPPSTEPRSVTDRLKELSKLHEEGIVSDDEFKELRTNLLREL